MGPFKIVTTDATNTGATSEPAALNPAQVISKAVAEGESIDYESHENEIDHDPVLPCAPVAVVPKPFRVK